MVYPKTPKFNPTGTTALPPSPLVLPMVILLSTPKADRSQTGLSSFKPAAIKVDRRTR